MNDGKMKAYILLQHHKGLFALLYRFVKGSEYNHASIGIDPELNIFYSFRSKWGFCIEHPFRFDKEHKRHIQCSVYEITIVPECYEKLQDTLRNFEAERTSYHYSYLSLCLGFLGIKHDFMNGYFCSRFVAEVLEHSGSLRLMKDHSIYLPSDFRHEDVTLCFEGRAHEFAGI